MYVCMYVCMCVCVCARASCVTHWPALLTALGKVLKEELPLRQGAVLGQQARVDAPSMLVGRRAQFK